MRTFVYRGFSGARVVALSAAGQHTDRPDLAVPLWIRLEVGDNGHDGATSAATWASASDAEIVSFGRCNTRYR
jgi:hypothetical protein